MPAPGSVTAWIEQLKAGDAAAAATLWQGYFRRLVGLARQRLGAAPRGVADEEDVALSAFDSFCRAAAQGRLPHLDDRDDLWQVLMMLTARKAINLIERECSQKRGGGHVVPAAAWGGHTGRFGGGRAGGAAGAGADAGVRRRGGRGVPPPAGGTR